MKTSRYSQIIWNINGTVLLIAFIIAIVASISWIIEEMNYNSYEYNKGAVVGKPNEKAKEIGLDLQHLLYDRPEKIAFTDYYFSEVYVLDKEIPKRMKEVIYRANDISMSLFGGTINIIFFNSKTEETYPLLETYGYISSIDIPHYYNGVKPPEEKRRKWNLYKIANNDSNGDGRINEMDNSPYFISDIFGKALTQITPDTLQLDSHWIDDDGNKIYFESITQLDNKDEFGFMLKTRTLYIYDISLDKFYKFEKMQSVFDSLQRAFRNQ